MSLTNESVSLFIALAKDAGNWSGTPMIDITKAQRGNLTQLKAAGVLTTFTSDGEAFASFTAQGKALAAEHGISL